ncbi:MAG TPA: HNH endonuclease, partial [Burkholderiales bacterium]|nr:HNH endonuclease [Burkholderiales bacterium]
ARYRTGQIRGDPEIGCNVLTAPFFLSEDRWVPVPRDWSKHIVRGKTYDTTDTIGAELWQRVRANMVEATGQSAIDTAEAQRFGAEYLARARLGQGAFRVLVTDAYHRRCAVTGEKTLPVLQAAHIRPFAENGPNTVDNGLLLRSDLHTLFDLGYLTVTDEYRVEVSQQIRTRFENGREYYRYDGHPLAELPEHFNERPSSEFLEWHRDSRFIG